MSLSALLKNSIIKIDYEATKEVLRYKFKQDTLRFLQCIADAKPGEVKEYLEENPEFAANACGSVTTVSGNTYENVTAIQLMYLMDDNEMFVEAVLPYIQKLKPELIKIVEMQLSNKMEEVEKQRHQFKLYYFGNLLDEILRDQTLRDSGQPNDRTKQALAKFKDDFKPGIITEGKSWIKNNLQHAFNLDREYPDLRENRKVFEWFIINVVGHVQTLVEKCFEQECSQGLIRGQKNKRKVQIEDTMYTHKELTYRESVDSSLKLSRDYFVEINTGLGWGAESAGRWLTVYGRWETHPCIVLDHHLSSKNQQWEKIKSSLTNIIRNNLDFSEASIVANDTPSVKIGGSRF